MTQPFAARPVFRPIAALFAAALIAGPLSLRAASTGQTALHTPQGGGTTTANGTQGDVTALTTAMHEAGYTLTDKYGWGKAQIGSIITVKDGQDPSAAEAALYEAMVGGRSEVGDEFLDRLAGQFAAQP